jgi:NTE family protein
MPLLKEMRINAMLRRGNAGIHGEGARWASMRMPRITSEFMVKLGHASKRIAEWDNHGRDVGKRASFDVNSMF